MIRKAEPKDIDGIEKIYEDSHTIEEKYGPSTRWVRGVYPSRETAVTALERGDLFVMEEDGEYLGTAIINKLQCDFYEDIAWEHKAAPENVCVIHTLAISPAARGRGCGKAFLKYYEDYALEHDARELRLDTNVLNKAARSMYGSLGYKEVGEVTSLFNGIPDVTLVLLEKNLTS